MHECPYCHNHWPTYREAQQCAKACREAGEKKSIPWNPDRVVR